MFRHPGRRPNNKNLRSVALTEIAGIADASPEKVLDPRLACSPAEGVTRIRRRNVLDCGCGGPGEN